MKGIGSVIGRWAQVVPRHEIARFLGAIFVIFLFLGAALCFGAEVQNIRPRQEGNNIVFNFDVVGATGEKETKVTVVLVIDGKEYTENQLHLQGDYGKVKVGNSKRVTWQVLQDFPNGFGGDLSWRITAGQADAKGAAAGPALTEGSAPHQITLKDGSVVKGKLQCQVIKLKTNLGTVQCPVSNIVTLKLGSIKLKDGTSLKGHILDKTLPLETRFGLVLVPSLNIKELTVVQEPTQTPVTGAMEGQPAAPAPVTPAAEVSAPPVQADAPQAAGPEQPQTASAGQPEQTNQTGSAVPTVAAALKGLWKALTTPASTSINYMQNLLDSCAAGDTRHACVWIGETVSSTCKKTDQCAESMASTLRVNNITFITNDAMAPYSDNVANRIGYQPGCIGYRSDIGGTKEGATALANLLGPSQFYVDYSSCHVAGFKYNVIRR